MSFTNQAILLQNIWNLPTCPEYTTRYFCKISIIFRRRGVVCTPSSREWFSKRRRYPYGTTGHMLNTLHTPPAVNLDTDFLSSQSCPSHRPTSDRSFRQGNVVPWYHILQSGHLICDSSALPNNAHNETPQCTRATGHPQEHKPPSPLL